jgi:hypothetical protein
MFGLNKFNFGKKDAVKDKKAGWLFYSKTSSKKNQLNEIIENGDKPYPIGTDLEQVVRNMLLDEFPQDLIKSSSFDLIVSRTVQRLKERQMAAEEQV